MSHRSAGFTLIEVLGVLVVTAVIATGVWSVTESVMRGHVQAMNDDDRASYKAGCGPATAASVESSRGAVAWLPGFPDPLIEPDVRISRIRLSDWVHFKACESATRRRPPSCTSPSSARSH